ncbi:hypothetical protein QTP86_008498 [Hemibagrus guttatus]|nr:hypothetical protein QTP86_008498 [Hemibagrus guttatus]
MAPRFIRVLKLLHHNKVAVQGGRPFDVAVFEDTLWFSNWEDNHIYHLDKRTGSDVKRLSVDSVQPASLVIVHPLIKPGVDLCLHGNGGCSQLCESSLGLAHCSCHSQHVLSADGKTCFPIDTSSSSSSAGSGDGEWSDQVKNKSLNDESSPLSQSSEREPFTEKMVSGFPLDGFVVIYSATRSLVRSDSEAGMLRRLQFQFIPEVVSGAGAGSGLCAGHSRSSLQPSPPHRSSWSCFVHRDMVMLEQGLDRETMDKNQDECFSLRCDVNAQCVLEDGVSVCRCLSGFTGDGELCMGWRFKSDLFYLAVERSSASRPSSETPPQVTTPWQRGVVVEICPSTHDSYCLNNAVCFYFPEMETFACNCVPGYMGERCQYSDLEWWDLQQVEEEKRRNTTIAVCITVVILLLSITATITYCYRYHRYCYRYYRQCYRYHRNYYRYYRYHRQCYRYHMYYYSYHGYCYRYHMYYYRYHRYHEYYYRYHGYCYRYHMYYYSYHGYCYRYHGYGYRYHMYYYSYHGYCYSYHGYYYRYHGYYYRYHGYCYRYHEYYYSYHGYCYRYHEYYYRYHGYCYRYHMYYYSYHGYCYRYHGYGYRYHMYYYSYHGYCYSYQGYYYRYHGYCYRYHMYYYSYHGYCYRYHRYCYRYHGYYYSYHGYCYSYHGYYYRYHGYYYRYHGYCYRYHMYYYSYHGYYYRYHRCRRCTGRRAAVDMVSETSVCEDSVTESPSIVPQFYVLLERMVCNHEKMIPIVGSQRGGVCPCCSPETGESVVSEDTETQKTLVNLVDGDTPESCTDDETKSGINGPLKGFTTDPAGHCGAP